MKAKRNRKHVVATRDAQDASFPATGYWRLATGATGTYILLLMSSKSRTSSLPDHLRMSRSVVTPTSARVRADRSLMTCNTGARCIEMRVIGSDKDDDVDTTLVQK